MVDWLRSKYKSVQSNFPPSVNKLVSQVDFLLAAKPVVKRKNETLSSVSLREAAVVFSLDFEMAWAWQYARDRREDYVAKGLWEREQIPRLLSQFDEFRIPATWATVGHLFLRNCSRGTNGLAHPDMPRLQPFETKYWNFKSGDWFQNDPCTDYVRDPAWYAPDLIEKILAARVRHEIGCHSFSHAGFGFYCSDEVARAEINACRDAMRSFGVVPTTWIFPGHEEGKFSLLKESGFRVVRAYPDRHGTISLPSEEQYGLWSVPVSSSIDRGSGWTARQRLRWLQKLVDAAIETKLSAHVWFHPSLSTTELVDTLVPLLRYSAALRDKGLLRICTMEQLVEATIEVQTRKPG